MSVKDFSTSNYLGMTAFPIGKPYFLFGWGFAGDAVNGQVMICAREASFVYDDLRQQDSFTRATSHDGGSNPQATALDYTPSAWAPSAGAFVASAERRAYHEAATDDETTSKVVAPGSLRIGVNDEGGPAKPWTGSIAEVSIWDLTGFATADIQDLFDELRTGLNPLVVNAQSGEVWEDALVRYWPLEDETDLTDRMSGAVLSMTGTLTEDMTNGHPSVDDPPAIIFRNRTPHAGNYSSGEAAFAFEHAGGDILLRVGLGFEDNGTFPTFEYDDGTAADFSEITPIEGSQHHRVCILMLRGKAAGSGTIRPRTGWTGNKLVTLEAISVQGLTSGTPYRTAVGNSGTGTTPATVTLDDSSEVQAGDVVVDVCTGKDPSTAPPTLTVGANQTQQTNQNSAQNSLGTNTITSYEAGASSVTMSHAVSDTANDEWRIVAVALIPESEAAGTAAVTGTLDGSSSIDVRDGGKTIVATLTGDTFIGSFSNTDKQNILNGIVAAVTQANGWNNQRSNIDHTTAVVRTSATVVTITLPALPGLHLDHDETLTWTIPASVLTGASAIVATPTVRIAKKEPDAFAKVLLRI